MRQFVVVHHLKSPIRSLIIKIRCHFVFDEIFFRYNRKIIQNNFVDFVVSCIALESRTKPVSKKKNCKKIINVAKMQICA